jgi:hypothetical protein
MSADYSQSSFDPSSSRTGTGPRRHCHGEPWKPVEILAMVLGFLVFWPIGVAILVWKFWQRKTGYEGDIVSFGRERWDAMRHCTWPYGSHHWGAASRGWRSGPTHSGSTGNYAFDEWRSAELERLEEEYRKLVAAEREFAEFMENLRRARDREEFDRFMNDRRSRQA